MTKWQAVEALDSTMRDITGKYELPIGGKTIVFGGDFRQVLPVVRKGAWSLITEATLRKSYLWENMRHLRLVHNMRAHSDQWFAEYIKRVGNGTEDTVDDDYVRIPDEIYIPYTGRDSDINLFIESVFLALNDNLSDPNYITSRAILSTWNEYVDKINMRMIEKFPGEEVIYHSFDRAEDDPHNYYPAEFLTSLTPSGLPPHIWKLKINCPIILLRNIDPANGLCYGTRLGV